MKANLFQAFYRFMTDTKGNHGGKLFVLAVLAYIVMLSVMTYNVYILVAAVLGSLAALQLCPVFSEGLVKRCLGLSNANTDTGSEQPEEKPLRNDDQKK